VTVEHLLGYRSLKNELLRFFISVRTFLDDFSKTVYEKLVRRGILLKLGQQRTLHTGTYMHFCVTLRI
jgi:hypothetical protein